MMFLRFFAMATALLVACSMVTAHDDNLSGAEERNLQVISTITRSSGAGPRPQPPTPQGNVLLNARFDNGPDGFTFQPAFNRDYVNSNSSNGRLQVLLGGVDNTRVSGFITGIWSSRFIVPTGVSRVRVSFTYNLIISRGSTTRRRFLSSFVSVAGQSIPVDNLIVTNERQSTGPNRFSMTFDVNPATGVETISLTGSLRGKESITDTARVNFDNVRITAV